MSRRCLWVLLLCAFSTAVAADTTLLVTRHAEKRVGVDDPPLSERGEQRAQHLNKLLEYETVDAIYSTDTRRTRATVTPLAVRSGLVITSYDPADASFAQHLIEQHGNQTVVIVGHSNTVPELLRGLGLDDAPELSESDYDRLFIVHIDDAGAASLLTLHY